MVGTCHRPAGLFILPQECFFVHSFCFNEEQRRKYMDTIERKRPLTWEPNAARRRESPRVLVQGGSGVWSGVLGDSLVGMAGISGKVTVGQAHRQGERGHKNLVTVPAEEQPKAELEAGS